jgi:LmbE family N-acetylglucosaminyl deacetylase
MNLYDHIYLSPHLDDVALSSGGHSWQQVQAGDRVLVVVIFAGSPPADVPLSPFAQELHAQWGYLTDTVARRRQEDLAALALLGVEALHWSYADCIYRQALNGHFPYDSEEALLGEVHPAEEGLVAELASRLTALPLEQSGMVYTPMGVGHHVDHQIVRRAAEMCGHALVYYEDYPYAEDPQATHSALEGRQWQTELVPLSEEALEAKIAAIACYHSQLSVLGWPQVTDMAVAVRAFAERIGGDGPMERYWFAAPFPHP